MKSSERVVITIKVPTELAAALMSEAKSTGVSLASLTRKAIHWHQGPGLSRHPRSPQIHLEPPSGKVISKSMLINPEHVEYLDSVGDWIGLPRTSTLLIVLAQYLDLNPVAPQPR